MRDLSGNGCSGTTSGRATVWTPAWYTYAVHCECSQEGWSTDTPLLHGARGCTVGHGRQEALEAAVHADPGLRATAAGLGGRPDDGEYGRCCELC